jgi:hypothetical protein
VDSSGNPLPDSSAPGAPSFNFNGGGVNSIVYDSSLIKLMQNSLYFKVIASREITY